MNAQMGRAPQAPAPFVGAAEGRPHFCVFRAGVWRSEVFWLYFSLFFQHFRPLGVEVAGSLPICRAGVSRPEGFSVYFLHFSCIFGKPCFCMVFVFFLYFQDSQDL